MSDLTKQPVPSETRCPECGADPTDDSIVEHRLAATGYLHDDVHLECAECSNTWTLGIPIGEFDGGSDLWCSSCNNSPYLVHRVELISDSIVELHMKCPACKHFPIPSPRRTLDDQDVALVGYPSITGSTDGAEPYGYTE